MTEQLGGRFTDEELWNVVAYTMEKTVLPVLPRGYEWDAAHQLMGVARFAKNRLGEADAATDGALRRALALPPSVGRGEILAAASACLVEALGDGGSVAGTEQAAEVRTVLLEALEAELAAATPLMETFAKHGRDAVDVVEHDLTPDHRAALTEWFGRTLGKDVLLESVSLIPGGHSRRMLRIALKSEEGVRNCIVRIEQDGMFGTEGNTEARAMSALEAAGIRVPHVIGAENSGTVLGSPFFVMDVVEGTPDLVQGDLEVYGRALHALHRTDPAVMTPALGAVPGSAEDAIACQLDFWEGVYRGSSLGCIPLLDETITWLRRNLRPTGNTTIVHGDPGPGNFLMDNGTVAALLDWEFVGYGDPAADWSYLATVRGRTIRSLPEWKVWLSETVGVEYQESQWLSWEIFNRFKAVCADLTPFDIIRRGNTLPPNLVAVGAGIHKRFLREMSMLTASYATLTEA